MSINTIPTFPAHEETRLTFAPHSPKIWNKTQYAEYDISSPVGKEKQKHVLTVNDKFLWHADQLMTHY